MTKRDIVFSKKHIEQIPANQLETGKKGFKIDTKSFISFQPNNKPELNWGISKINIIFDTSLSDISDEIQNKKFFTLEVESDDNIGYRTKNDNWTQLREDFRVIEGSDDENGTVEIYYPHPTRLVKHKLYGDNVFDEQLWRTKSIKSVEGVWKRNSNDSTITGTINGNNIETVLGANWEATLIDKHTEEEIEKQSGKLFRKIIAEAKSQKITINFTSKSIKEILSPPKNTKGLKIKLEEGIKLHIFTNAGRTKEEKTFQQINLFFEKGKADAEEQYNMLTNSENKNFELEAEDGVVSRGGVEEGIRIVSLEHPSIKVYNYHRFNEPWKNGQITLKKTESKLNTLIKNLQTAIASGDKDQLVSTIAEGRKSEEESNSSELSRLLTEAEKKLGSLDQKAQRESILSNFQSKMTLNSVKPDQLSSEAQAAQAELTNKEDLTEDRVEEINTLVINNIGETSLTNLITKIKQALTAATPQQLKKFQQELTKFQASTVSYKKHAYQKNQSEVDQLLEQLAEKENTSTPFWRQPKVIIPLALISLLVLLIIVIVSSNNSSRKRG